MGTTHKLIIGHVMDALKSIESESIDLIITSPPYFSLRNYGNNCSSKWNDGWYGQLGLEPTLEMFIAHLIEVFREIKRVLKPTGSFYLNLGDCYAGHKGFDNLAYGGKPHDDIKNHTTTHLPAKCLTLFPSRVALALIDNGWILRNDIIWSKPNHMPSSVKDRLTNSYEHIFHFVKQQKYYYDLDAIRIPHKVCGVTDKRPMGVLRQKLYPNSEYHKSDDTHLKQYQGKFEGNKDAESFGSPRTRTQRKLKQDNVPSKNSSLYKGFNKRWKESKYRDAKGSEIDPRYTDENGPMSWAKWKADHPATTHKKGKNPSDTWIMTTEPYPEAHFATYPQKICVRPIKSSCPEGTGVVLDPFAGSGTTAKVARELGRNSISIDINPDSRVLWWKRVSAGESLDDKFEVETVE